jgi:hypothetical protein
MTRGRLAAERIAEHRIGGENRSASVLRNATRAPLSSSAMFSVSGLPSTLLRRLSSAGAVLDATVVVLDHLVQGGEPTVVHERRRLADVLQRRRLECRVVVPTPEKPTLKRLLSAKAASC